MITTYLVTGDLHGRLDRFFNLHYKYNPQEIAIICLGDCGFNFWLNNKDYKMKQQAKELGFIFYCVRGNHEARPQSLSRMTLKYDEEIAGMVYYEPEFPNIRYLLDGGEYNIDGYTTLVIGGAYSVDKWYRILRNGYTEENNNPKATGWWADEQLSMEEMAEIAKKVQGKHFDLILTHTCPASIEPVDLFLSFINQKEVDKSTEYFLETIKNRCYFDKWLFGHYHSDRTETPKFEQLYQDIVSLNDLCESRREAPLGPKYDENVEDLTCEECHRQLVRMCDFDDTYSIYTCWHCDYDYKVNNFTKKVERYYFG